MPAWLTSEVSVSYPAIKGAVSIDLADSIDPLNPPPDFSPEWGCANYDWEGPNVAWNGFGMSAVMVGGCHWLAFDPVAGYPAIRGIGMTPNGQTSPEGNIYVVPGPGQVMTPPGPITNGPFVAQHAAVRYVPPTGFHYVDNSVGAAVNFPFGLDSGSSDLVLIGACGVASLLDGYPDTDGVSWKWAATAHGYTAGDPVPAHLTPEPIASQVTQAWYGTYGISQYLYVGDPNRNPDGVEQGWAWARIWAWERTADHEPQPPMIATGFPGWGSMNLGIMRLDLHEGAEPPEPVLSPGGGWSNGIRFGASGWGATTGRAR